MLADVGALFLGCTIPIVFFCAAMTVTLIGVELTRRLSSRR